MQSLCMRGYDFHPVELCGGLQLLVVFATISSVGHGLCVQAWKTLVSASLTYSMVIFASMFGMLLWQDQLSLSAWLAILLIVVCGLICS